MSGGKRFFSRALCLVGVGLAAGTATAAARSPAADPAPATVVIHGSLPDPAAPAAGGGSPAVVVLRGAPPAPPPPAEPACPPDSVYVPGPGCVIAGYAYQPYDYGYWPYFGVGDVFVTRRPVIVRRRAFRPGIAHRAGVGLAPRLGFRTVHGFVPGFGRVGVGGPGRR